MTDAFLIQLTTQLREMMSRHRIGGHVPETRRKEINTLVMILRSHPEIEEEILIALLLSPGVQDVALYVDLLNLVCHAPKVIAVVSKSSRFPEVLSYISQMMQRILTAATSCLDSPSAHSGQLSLLLDSEQLVCKLLQSPTSDSLGPEAFGDLLGVLMRVIEDVRVIDCLSAAGMIALLVMKKTHRADFEAQIHACLAPKAPPTAACCSERIFAAALHPPGPPIVRCSAFLGVTGMLDAAALAWSPANGAPLCLRLLERLHAEPDPSEHSTKLLHCRAIHLWHKKMTEVVPSLKEPSVSVFRSLVGLSPSVEFVFNHLEDPIDIVKYQSREILQFILKSHQKACEEPSCPSCPALSALLNRILDLSWLRTGKFALLTAFSSLRSATPLLLARCPQLPRLLVKQAGADQCLASNAGDLYRVLLINTVKAGKKAGGVEVALWACPVFKALLVREDSSEESQSRRTLISQYFLPKLVKHLPECLDFLVDSFCKESTLSVGPVISCFRRARIEGTLTAERQARLSPDLLRSAILHHDQQVRLDAFALLCEQRKTSAPLSEAELDLISCFLRHNLDGQTPAYRQQLASFLKKLFARLCDGSAAAAKRFQKNAKPEDQAIVARYADFGCCLQQSLLRVLEPGVSFPRRITALSCLCVCRQLPESKPHRPSSRETAHLLLALTDSFEENREASFGLLRADNHYLVPLLPSLRSSAFALAQSVRPQDCSIANKLFHLVSHLSADAAADSALFAQLLAGLGEQVAAARESLLRAAASRPMYPTLHCLRHFIERCPAAQRASLLQQTLPDLLELCYAIGELVSPVVANASPEGNCPLGPGLDIGAALADTEADADAEEWTAARMPEFLVVCCWRSVKEVSLTLGVVATKLIEAEPLCLTNEQVLRIGLFFRDQLLESRHRGAFELAAAGFQQLCETLWRAKSPDLARLPETWLKEVLAEVHKANSDLDLCATRRSAGLPHYIKAIVGSQRVTSSRTTLQSVMKSLLSVASEATVESSTEENYTLIHALNILRSLYRDATLGDEMQSFVTDGVKMAIVGFSSPLWSIRNAATMLFSALMQRIFGVSRSRDEASKKNRLSSRVFFNRYPKLYDFLLGQLQLCTLPAYNPRLFPLLLILSRLLPPAVEAADSSLRLEPFLPLVHSCGLRSRDFRIRALAARALVPLLHRCRLANFTLHLIEAGLSPETGAKHANALHGLLLQIELLVTEVISEAVAPPSVLLQLLSSLLYRSEALFSARSVCPIVRGAFLRCAAPLITATPCQRTVELFFRFLGPQLLPLLTATSGQQPLEKVDALPGDSEHLKAFSEVVFAVLEVLEATSLRSNVPLDLIDSGLDFLEHLIRCPSNAGVREASCCFLQRLLAKKRRGDVVRRLRKRSGPLMTDLALRVGAEANAEALAALLGVLTQLAPLTPSFTAGLSTLRLVAELLENARRQEVALAALPLAGKLWRHGAAEAALRQRIVAEVQRRGGWDQGAEMREACAVALKDLFAAGEHLSADPQVALPLWNALFTALNDYEASVRHSAAGIVAELVSQRSGGQREIQTARVAFSRAVAIFVEENGCRQGTHFWERVRNWMANGVDCESEVLEHQQIRLFDRGEMNIFMDQAAFARTLAEAVTSASLRAPPSLLDLPPTEADGRAEASEEAETEAERWSVAALFEDTAALETRSLQALRSRLWRSCVLGVEVTEPALHLQ